jgi:hypothetical protein
MRFRHRDAKELSYGSAVSKEAMTIGIEVELHRANFSGARNQKGAYLPSYRGCGEVRKRDKSGA